MARPVKETPILSGSDAERFDKEIKKSESTSTSSAEKQRVLDNYKRVKLNH